MPPFAVIVAFTDLGELRRMRSASRCARGAAALAATAAGSLVLRCAPDGLILDAHGAAGELVGCETHEILGHRCEERVHPEDAAAVRAAYREAMASRDTVRLHHRVVRVTGEVVSVERRLHAVRDGEDVLEVQSVIRRASVPPE